jgi:hypothetical protein
MEVGARRGMAGSLQPQVGKGSAEWEARRRHDRVSGACTIALRGGKAGHG